MENNEYVVDYREINTIYQTSMIHFAEDNSGGLYFQKGLRFSTDSITSWQTSGLTGIPFFSGYLYTDPLTDNYDPRTNMILLHYSGIAGKLNERLNLRNQTAINQFKINPNLYNGNYPNVIYDNSQSFIIITKFNLK